MGIYKMCCKRYFLFLPGPVSSSCLSVAIAWFGGVTSPPIFWGLDETDLTSCLDKTTWHHG